MRVLPIANTYNNNQLNNRTTFRAQVNKKVLDNLLNQPAGMKVTKIFRPKGASIILPTALLAAFFQYDEDLGTLSLLHSNGQNDELLKEFIDNPQQLVNISDVKTSGNEGLTLPQTLSSTGLEFYNKIIGAFSKKKLSSSYLNVNKHKQNSLHMVKDSQTAKIIQEALTSQDLQRVHCMADVDGNFPMHLAANSEIVKCFHDSLSGNKDLFTLIHTQKNKHGEIPLLSAGRDAQIEIMKTFSNSSELWQSLYTTPNNKGNIYAHIADFDNIAYMCDLLKEDNPNLLVKILCTTNNAGRTPLDELRARGADISDLSNIIISLATNSEVDVRDSINLLKQNNIAPALAEYLEVMHIVDNYLEKMQEFKY